jgi:hypothetical protein
MKSFFTGVALAFAFSIHASATSVPYKSFDELIKEAEGIVAGRVVATESQYSPQKDIYTFVTFDRLEILAGSYQDSTLILRFKGGQVGNDILHVDGCPEFKVNDRVVLFVSGNGRYMVPLVGWTQGVFRIVQDAATGQQLVNDYEGNRVLGIQAGHVIRERIARSEAQIVGDRQSIGTPATQNEASAGVPDYGPKAEPPHALAARSFKDTPTMTTHSFFAAIGKSMASKRSTTQLNSVSITDFSAPSGNADAFRGNKPASGQAPQSQPPALPKRLPDAHEKDQL